MKKRIISLILVVAMAFLTLTGCSYNYAKDDMSKYATLDLEAFYGALQALNITDGDFGTDEEARKVKVQDAIAQAILKITDTTDKQVAGKLNGYDAFYFCYYATDDAGNVFFADKMDASKATNFQLGLSTLSDLNKLIAEKVVTIEDLAAYIYNSNAASVVAETDAVSVSYEKTWNEGTAETPDMKSETADHVYVELVRGNEFHDFLVGKLVGVNLGDVTVTETAGGETKEYTYKNVKVESIARDSDAGKPEVKGGDKVYVTYTVSFDATPWLNEQTGKYELPSGYDATKVNAEGKYEQTYTKDVLTAVAAEELPELPEGATDEEKAAYEEQKKAIEEAKTFLNHLVGKKVGTTTSSITVKNEIIGEETVEVKYTSVTVNWIVNTENAHFTVDYKLYDEELKDDNSNKKTETNVKGEKVVLNGKTLTYHIFPVYYLDVKDLDAKLILEEFYSVVASTQTKEHDHTEDDHEHETEFVFDTLNGNYKNGETKLSTLVEELVKLYGSTSDSASLLAKEKTLTEALTALEKAQTKLGADDRKSESETGVLEKNVDNALDTYLKAKKAVDEVKAKIDEKITKILGCKDGETTVEAGLVEDYKTYQYDTLEATYKADIKEKLAAKVIEYLEANVKFTGNLPKRAVKNAYEAIMNTYKYDFYEGKYSSGSSTSTSTSTSAETNYHYYGGDFNAYLVDKVAKGKDMAAVKAAIQLEAENTVKDIILVYIFSEAVDAKWEGAEVILTKAEKKQIKKDLENMALLYQQYGLSYTYNLDDSYHAQQFDKAMNYLLEENETEGNVVEYKHIKYTTEAQAK